MPLLEGTSLKRKQILVIMLVTGVALVLACAAFATYDVLTFRKTMISKVVTLAEIVGDNSAAAIDFQDSKSAEETLAQLKDDPYVMRSGIYDPHRNIFAVSVVNTGSHHIRVVLQLRERFLGRFEGRPLCD